MENVTTPTKSLAVGKVLATVTTEPKTMKQIHEANLELTIAQVSMALCYLRDKRKSIVAHKQPRAGNHGRKIVNAYILNDKTV